MQCCQRALLSDSLRDPHLSRNRLVCSSHAIALFTSPKHCGLHKKLRSALFTVRLLFHSLNVNFETINNLSQIENHKKKIMENLVKIHFMTNSRLKVMHFMQLFVRVMCECVYACMYCYSLAYIVVCKKKKRKKNRQMCCSFSHFWHFCFINTAYSIICA